MNILKYSFNLVVLVILTFVTSFAQQNTVSNGGNISGIGGKISFSVGQISYEVFSSQFYNITGGVQHPYEIFSTDLEDFSDKFETMIYPNPATDMINVRISEIDFRKPEFKVVDLNGRKLNTGTLNQRETAISFDSYPSGIYMLLISENGKSLRSFKIVKN